MYTGHGKPRKGARRHSHSYMMILKIKCRHNRNIHHHHHHHHNLIHVTQRTKLGSEGSSNMFCHSQIRRTSFFGMVLNQMNTSLIWALRGMCKIWIQIINRRWLAIISQEILVRIKPCYVMIKSIKYIYKREKRKFSQEQTIFCPSRCSKLHIWIVVSNHHSKVQ